MRKLLPHLYINKKLLFEFLLVFAAFFIMALIGSFFGASIVSKNIASYGDEVISSSAETLNAYLNESKITLYDIAFSIEKLKNEKAGPDQMLESIVAWTEWMLDKDKRFESFSGVYGVVDGVFVDGTLWEPPDDYDPQTRPWYIGALEKNGEIFYADPYIDAQTGNYVLTVSKRMFDKDGNPFGVIAIDVFITGIYNYVEDLKLLNSGYGILLDSNRIIAIHPDKSLIGTRMENVNEGVGGYSEISNQIALDKGISAFQYTSYMGVKSVAFFKKLSNGWHVGIISPSKVYYNDVYNMVALLSVAGFILMALLCFMLTLLHIEKHRSDEANRIKSSFLANMSHEIRTPMNAIIGMSELLSNEPLNNRQQGYVDDINRSSHALLSIINDILDLSKIESGKLELSQIDYDFQVFIDNIASMVRFMTQKKGIEFRFEKIGEIPKCLSGDDIRLRQVLTNICGNALKFTSTGFIHIKVISAPETIIFEIKDSGVGIRKEDLPNLFDAFSQADTQKNRNVVGTGLGLAISKTFIEMMGGKIEVDSIYGQGTVFTVTIPKILGDETAIKYTEKGEKGKIFSAPSAKILVVDDNAVNLKVASGLLNLYKINNKTALSGKEAVALIKETDFDIVFMDHMMPEMDGIETTKQIRKLGGKYKHLTIIALTANAIRGAKEMFISSGFNGFISKPIDLDELTEILKGMLPSEKIEENFEVAPPETGSKDNELPGSFLDSVRNIKSINTEIGLSRVSGLEKMYHETLEIFYKKLLSECEKMDRFLKSEDLDNLAISVHGMKSSLSTIGAMELSELAFALEKASKNKDLIYCQEHFPEFSAKLRPLHEQLAEVFQSEQITADKPAGDVEYLQEFVKTALAAADEFDSDLGVEAISKLLEFDFGTETNELLKNANMAFKDFDFDAAVESLNKIIGK